LRLIDYVVRKRFHGCARSNAEFLPAWPRGPPDQTGRYLSIIPEFLLQLPERHPFLKKLPVELPIASAPIGIVALKNRKPSPVVQRFIDCARDVAKSLSKRSA
jgi:hypothetical protein